MEERKSVLLRIPEPYYIELKNQSNSKGMNMTSYIMSIICPVLEYNMMYKEFRFEKTDEKRD